MPLYTLLGEQSLNANIDEDQAGRGVSLVQDSDYDLLGIVQELDGNARKIYAFFVVGDRGEVTPRILLGEDTIFVVAQTDQDAFLIYPEDGSAAYPPVVVRADGSVVQFEGDIAEYSPQYRITEGGLVSYDTGQPAGNATQSNVEGGFAQVYTAPDGDGTGVFVRITDDDGHAIGGVVRVNSDTAGDQVDPIIGRLDEAFTVAWTQQVYDGANTEEYRAITFRAREPNLPLAIQGVAGNQTVSGDLGDYQTDIFFYDTRAGGSLGRDRIEAFGLNDILVTTSAIRDGNGDGIINFSGNKLLDLTDARGRPASQLEIAGVRSLEFDGTMESDDGQTYYVYSRVNSAADEYYLIV